MFYLFYPMIPAKKIIGCRYFAKCTSQNLTLGALGKSGISKGATIRKGLGTTAVNRYFVVTRDSPIFHVFLPISVSLSFSVSVRASCLPVYPTGFHSFPTSVIASRSSFIIMFCAKKIIFLCVSLSVSPSL